MIKPPLTLTIAFLLLQPWPAEACQPCPEVLTFEQTVRQSDLIIVGQQAGQYPPAGFVSTPFDPEWIRVEVLRVLKGTATPDAITVNSYDGMCPRGIVLEDDGRYVFFLAVSSHGDIAYDAVHDGCALKVLPVNGNRVTLNGKAVLLDIFSIMLERILGQDPDDPFHPVP